jgi:signal transduction histidine kinase
MNLAFNKKIRNKLILIFLTPTFVIVITFGLINHAISKRGLEQELSKRLIAVAKSASTQLPVDSMLYLEQGDETTRLYKNIFKKLERLKNLNEVKKIYVFNRDNRALVDTDPEINIGYYYAKHELDKNEIADALIGIPRSSVMFQGKDKEYYKTGYATVFSKTHEPIIIGVEGSVQFFQTLRKISAVLLWFIFLSIMAILLASILFSQSMVAPISNLVMAVAKISSGDLNSKVPVQTKDEIGFLSFKFNQMRESLLERDNRMKMMLHGIAHEVRNPLGGIELFSGLLAEQMQTNPPKESLEFVTKIQKETENLKKVVNEFLDFARPVALNLKAESFQKFTADTELFFKNIMVLKNIKVKNHFPSDLPRVVFDAEYFHRVFLNLFENAIQSMPAGGTIAISAEVLRNGDESQFRIEFSDSGMGISKENLEFIFTPFFTTKAKGTGLGLAFVKKIIEEHQGSIQVESFLKKGTKFIISIPIKPV